MENSRYCKFVMIVTIHMSCLFIGYTFTCLNPLVPLLDSMYNETYLERYEEPISTSRLDLLRSLTFSIFLIGAFFASLMVNPLLRVLTRKQAMIFIHVTVIVGTLIIALGAGLTGSYEAFIVGRFVIGMSMGFTISILVMFIGEICIFRHQAFYSTLIGTVITIGDFLGPVLAHPKVLGTADLWPVMITMTMVPSVVYLGCATWMPETPYQVLRMEGTESAISLLMKLRVVKKNDENFEEAIDAEIRMMEQEQTRTEEVQKVTKTSSYPGIMEILRTKQYRMQFLGAMVMYGFEMLCGINNVFFYSDEIFRETGISDDKVTFATIGSMAMLIIGSIAGVFMVKKIGDKKVIMGTAGIICFALGLMTISLATVHLHSAMAYVSVVGVMFMFFGFSAGPNIAVHSLGVGITTEPTRPIILPIAGSVLWISGWLVGFLPSYLKEAMGPYGLLIWLGCTVLFMIYCGYFIPDTKGKTSDEIQNELKGKELSPRCG